MSISTVVGPDDALAEAADEVARRRAIELVGLHWHELSRRLARWLGQANWDDDSLPGEVALVMMRRYGNGKGSLVGHLRQYPASGDRELKEVLFREAKWAYREVIASVVRTRRLSGCFERLDDGVGESAASEAAGAFDFVEGSDGWRAVSPAVLDPTRVEAFMGAIEVLLSRGEAVWADLCDNGILDRATWTEDERWTAVGMMWQFSVAEITRIRQYKALGSAPTNDAATRRRMNAVREKGRVLLDAMPRADRCEYDLLDRRHRTKDSPWPMRQPRG